MTKKNISPEAEIWLNEELKKYKNDIISRVPFIKDGHEITVPELIQAKCNLENYNSLYNIQIRNMIKSQRGLLCITIISIFISFVSIIYYMIFNNNSINDIEYLTITMTGITFLVAMLTMMFALIIRNKRKHIPDKKMVFNMTKSYYKRLLNSGVKIYEYEPGFIHAKSFVADDIEAVVGTINLDYRSLYHHFECAAYCYGTACIGDIEKDFQKTLEKSVRITKKTIWKSYPLLKPLSFFIKIVAPLL